jgi:hypothetical protein
VWTVSTWIAWMSAFSHVDDHSGTRTRGAAARGGDPERARRRNARRSPRNLRDLTRRTRAKGRPNASI